MSAFTEFTSGVGPILLQNSFIRRLWCAGEGRITVFLTACGFRRPVLCLFVCFGWLFFLCRAADRPSWRCGSCVFDEFSQILCGGGEQDLIARA